MRIAYISLSTMLLLATPALADRPAADKCAGTLPKDARTIYNASVATFATAADGRAVVVEETRKLARSGAIAQAQARGSAEAAGKCLQLLK